MLHIRPYQDSDETAVCTLWRTVFPNAPAHNVPEADIARKRAVQRDLFRVALWEEVLVGTAMAGYDGHRGWIYYLAVHPDYRQRGIGAALVGDVERELAALGCPKLNLQVRASNAAVVAFYEKLGYCCEELISLGKRF